MSESKIDRVAKVQNEVEAGHDTTIDVSAWTRVLVSDEIARGGELEHAALAVDGSPQWGSVVREGFADLYSSDADVRRESQGEGSPWVGQILAQAQSIPEWIALKARTQGDEWATGLGLGSVLMTVAPEVKDKAPKSDERAAADAANTLEDLLKEFSETIEDDESMTPEEAKKLRSLESKLADATKRAAAAASDAVKAASALNQPATSLAIRFRIAAGASKAIAEIDETRAALVGLGVGTGVGQRVQVAGPRSEIVNLVRTNPHLRRVAMLAGRLRAEAARKQETKTDHTRGEVTSITVGGEIARLVPSELVYLSDPDLECILLRKLVEKTALEYEVKGRETKIRGPIVLLIDESGSMGGIRNEWAKAATLAFMDIAQRQNRAFSTIHYGYSVDRVEHVSRKSPLDVAKLNRIVNGFANGGTNVAMAVRKAIDLIDTAKGEKELADADLVMISDGIDGSLSVASGGDKLMASVRDLGVSMHGVAIDCSFGPELRGLCSSYVEVNQAMMHGASGVLDAAFSI